MAAQPGPAADPYPSLLSRIRAGDPEALVELYYARAAAVYSMALAVTGSAAAAAETTHDAFMSLWAQRDAGTNGAGRLRTRRPGAPWRVDGARPGKGKPEALPDPVGELSDALLLALSLTRAARANGSAAGLHPQQRLALAVASASGRTIRDTARILGLHYSTVLRQIGGGTHQV